MNDLRLPFLSGSTENKVDQIARFLYQLTEKLNFESGTENRQTKIGDYTITQTSDGHLIIE